MNKKNDKFHKELNDMLQTFNRFLDEREHANEPRPFTKTESEFVYKEIISRAKKVLIVKGPVFDTDMKGVSYDAGDYRVYSIYAPFADVYMTRITYHPKSLNLCGYHDRPLRNKRIQRLLHEYGERIK